MKNTISIFALIFAVGVFAAVGMGQTAFAQDETVKINYSQILHSLLVKMLSIDLRNRADWAYVNQWIFRYEGE